MYIYVYILHLNKPTARNCSFGSVATWRNKIKRTMSNNAPTQRETDTETLKINLHIAS